MNGMAADRKVKAIVKEQTEEEVGYEVIQERTGEMNGYEETLPKVQITRHVLIQRLNGNLGQDLRQLRKSRGPHTRISLGDYHIPEVHHNFIVKPHTTDDRMEEIARELGLLQKWEEVEK